MEDLETLESELVNEIAQDTGVLEGVPDSKKKSTDNKSSDDQKSVDADSYIESVQRKLEDVIDVEENAEGVNDFLDDVRKRIQKGESVEAIEKDVEASIKELSETSEDEDVIPASKHKKAIENMQKRIDDLYAQLKSREEREARKDPNSDSRLENMTQDQLEDLHDELDLALVEGELEGKELDSKGKRDVVKLKRKVLNLMQSAPQRFEQKKMDNLEKILNQVEKVVPDIRDQIKNRKGNVFDLAMKVHSGSRSMQRSEMGYADAFVLAAEHIQALPSKSQDQVQSLRSRLNKLKAKTSLAKSSSRGESTSARNEKLFQKAINGDRDEQEAWILNALVKPGGLA